MNDTSECELPSFQSTFINREYGNIIPFASINESYEMSNIANNMQFENQPYGNASMCNEAQNKYGSLQDYSEWIDTSKSIQPSNLLSEPLDLSNQKQSSKSTQQIENVVETGENTSVSTPRIIYENPPVESFEPEIFASSSLNKRFCPECGTEITPKSKLYQVPEVLNDSVSPTENIHPSSPKKIDLIRTEDVLDVVDFTPSEPVAEYNHSELFTEAEAAKKTDLIRTEDVLDVVDFTPSEPVAEYKHSELFTEAEAAKKTDLIRTEDVLDVVDFTPSEPVAEYNHSELFTEAEAAIQIQKLKSELNAGTDNAKIVLIAVPKTHLKRQSAVHSSLSTSRSKTEISTQAKPEVQVPNDSMLKIQICPNCGDVITPNSELNPFSGVVNGCICKRENNNLTSSKKTSLNRADVLDVAESSRSQLIINDNHQKRTAKKRIIQRRKLNHEINSDADYVPEVAITPPTGYPKTRLKRKCVRSNSSTYRNETEIPTQDELAAKIAASLMLKKQICPDCGKKITLDSNLNQSSGALNVCVCQRKDINGSSPNTSLNHTAVLVVADSSHWQPIISDNLQKSFLQQSNLQIQNLNPEGNTYNDNSSESPIAEWTGFTKIDIKREFVEHSGISTSRNKSDSDELEFQVDATSRQKGSICPICGKDFGKRSKLLRHSVVHTGKKPYLCPICGKGYAQKCYLIRHKVTHSDEKPFKCGICGKEFSQQCNLKRHSVVHRGYSPFNCGICLKGFAFKGDVFKHLVTHTSEKRIKYEF